MKVAGLLLILTSLPQAPTSVALAVEASNSGSAGASLSECGRGIGDYTATDLGAYVWPYAVNERGEVVGQRYVTTSPGNNGLRSFIWRARVFTDLGTGDASAAIAINERGRAVGTRKASIFGSDSAQAFLWQDGVARDLGTLGGSTSFGVDLNDRGQVVGVSQTASGETHPFLWQDGVMTDLASQGIPGGVRGINNRGQVVGQYENASGDARAYLWQRGTLMDLGAGSAVDINERGQVLISGPDGARLWLHGESIDLGVGLASEAVAMNDHGQVLLNVWSGGVAIWQAGKITPVESDAEAQAFALNNRGEIVGALARSGEFRGVLWSRSARWSNPKRSPDHSSGSPSLAVVSRSGARPLEFELRNAPSETYVASVFDIDGRLIQRWERSGAVIRRDFWDGRRRDGVAVAPGVYFLRVESNGRRYDTKVFLAR